MLLLSIQFQLLCIYGHLAQKLTETYMFSVISEFYGEFKMADNFPCSLTLQEKAHFGFFPQIHLIPSTIKLIFDIPL